MGTEEGEDWKSAYVRPAAFQANAIVTDSREMRVKVVVDGVVEVVKMLGTSPRSARASLRQAPHHVGIPAPAPAKYFLSNVLFPSFNFPHQYLRNFYVEVIKFINLSLK